MKAATSMGKAPPACPADLCHYLGACEFPGNIRELKATPYDAVERIAGRIFLQTDNL